MSVFSKRKTYVSSSLWNMAGNIEERTNYLKLLVLNGALTPTNSSIGEVIHSGTLNGPRMNYQAFYRWAKTNYQKGMPLGSIVGYTPINPEIVNSFIPVSPGYEADSELVNLDFADYWIWAEAHVMQYYPNLIGTDWNADINETTNVITITFVDNSTTTFSPINYDKTAKYIYARYSEVLESTSTDPTFVSADPDLGPYETQTGLLDTSNHYLLTSLNQSGVTQNRHNIYEVTKTYSDGRPSTVNRTKTVVGTQTYSRLVQIYERYVSLREDLTNPDRTWWDVDRIYVWEAPAYDTNLQSTATSVTEIEPGVFETTTTRNYLEEWRASGKQWWNRHEIWEKDNGIRSAPKLFIYKIGDGNAVLDALENTAESVNGFFPVIPLRTDNQMITEEPYLTDIYPDARKAWKRASGGRDIDKLLAKIEENPDLEDIDYSFLVWGVPLNVLGREGKLYTYRFFQELMVRQQSTTAEFFDYVNQMAEYNAYLVAYEEWLNSYNQEQTAPPTRPVKPTLMAPAATTIRTNGQFPETAHYDFRLNWNAISEDIFAGQWEVDAKINSVQLLKDDPVVVDESFRNPDSENFIPLSREFNVIKIFWQETENQYRVLTVYGGEHVNMVYGGKAVKITAAEALDDSDDSGFLVPMHYDVLKSLPIVWANQLATEGLYIIFNCYKIVRKKWYETFLGQILIIIAIVVVSAVFTGGFSALNGSGILGSNVAVGSMFGLTGVTGAVAGAAANALAGAVISQIMSTVLSKFGPIGEILSAIITIAMGATAGGTFSGSNFSFDVFLKADNLLKLTNATLNAYSIHVQAQTADVYTQMQNAEDEYNKQKREIDQLMLELIGVPSGFDPLILTESAYTAQESWDTYNRRTLMTGSELAELTHGLIANFTDASLDLENLRG